MVTTIPYAVFMPFLILGILLLIFGIYKRNHFHHHHDHHGVDGMNGIIIGALILILLYGLLYRFTVIG